MFIFHVIIALIILHMTAIEQQGSIMNNQICIKLSEFNSNSILMYIIENGLNIHFECKQGYCGACRARLISGKVKYINDPLAFILDGEFLTCSTLPETDLVIELY